MMQTQTDIKDVVFKNRRRVNALIVVGVGSAGTGQLLEPRVTLHLLTPITAIDKKFNVYLETAFLFSMFCIYSLIKVCVF